ncbi:hypothetical protein FS749_008297 [Ceratobasidium sp. UAMH 11750]|nr:hypothetical protein FS749_008297 [Ceratobasidium sp. UAMH 11750]
MSSATTIDEPHHEGSIIVSSITLVNTSEESFNAMSIDSGNFNDAETLALVINTLHLTNRPSFKYCKDWVASSSIAPQEHMIVDGPVSNSRTDGDSDEARDYLDDSEAEIEKLLRVVDSSESSGSDMGDAVESTNEALTMSSRQFDSRFGGAQTPTSKVEAIGYRTAATYPVSHIRSTAFPVNHYTRHHPHDRTPEPGDWVGPRFGSINYVLPPLHLTHLIHIGSQWSFSRTAPMSSCRNRLIGDINFTPGEVEGFEYWVCCEMSDTEAGRGWVPWSLGDTHPKYVELVLKHFTAEDAPLWAFNLKIMGNKNKRT